MKFDLSTVLVLGLTLLTLIGLVWVEIHSRRRQRIESQADGTTMLPEPRSQHEGPLRRPAPRD
jgi:hypothetical protein